MLGRYLITSRVQICECGTGVVPSPPPPGGGH